VARRGLQLRDGAMNDCGGCGKQLDVCKPVQSHERYGLLCPGCARFAADCEAEVARLRAFAEALAVLESAMNPRAVVN